MSKPLDSNALSAFCEGVAMMYAAGIQTDEAVYLLAENMSERDPMKQACACVYRELTEGNSLARAMDAQGSFPAYAVNLVAVGEKSGRLQNVLESLAAYYREESRMFARMNSAIAYPAALLAIMTVILAFTVAVILPVFVDVYEGIAGAFSAGAFSYVNVALGIGWVSLAGMSLCTLAAVVAVLMGRGSGRAKLMRIFTVLPATKDVMYRLALARFTAALSTFVSAGFDTDVSLSQALDLVDHATVRARVQKAYDEMVSPDQAKSLTQALCDNNVYDPMHARMLVVGARSGNLERVLRELGTSFFEDAVVRIDSIIDGVEPALAALLTVSVGATLVSVMLPLVGIMGSIG